MANMGSASSRGGIGFLGLLTLLFIALKLLGHIAWSWWWVLSPIWITGLVISTAVLGLGVLEALGEKLQRRR